MPTSADASVTTRHGRQRLRFRGHIAGLGSDSGVRVVIGRWHDTPLGAFADAMIARPDGGRLLLAPSSEVAQFVAATYTFDEIRIESFVVDGDAQHWRVRSTSLHLDLEVGRRTGVGRLLRLVPSAIAQAPWWCAITDLVARHVLRGVRTRGETRDRSEWYGATDSHALASMQGSFEGVDLGRLAEVHPPPEFGFSSTPARPSVTTVVTTVELAAPPG